MRVSMYVCEMCRCALCVNLHEYAFRHSRLHGRRGLGLPSIASSSQAGAISLIVTKPKGLYSAVTFITISIVVVVAVPSHALYMDTNEDCGGAITSRVCDEPSKLTNRISFLRSLRVTRWANKVGGKRLQSAVVALFELGEG